jgi:hypothetical protein
MKQLLIVTAWLEAVTGLALAMLIVAALLSAP